MSCTVWAAKVRNPQRELEIMFNLFFRRINYYTNTLIAGIVIAKRFMVFNIFILIIPAIRVQTSIIIYPF